MARTAFPRRPTVAHLAMAIVAFNPQFLLVASGVNNDNLVTPIATWVLFLLLRLRRQDVSVRDILALGALIGLAGLSKLSGWLLLPLAAVVLMIYLRHRAMLYLPLLAFPALALSSWWFLRNLSLYGDPTALRPMLKLVGTRSSPIYIIGEARLMLLSFWGQIPCSFYPIAFYIPYALLTSVALGGVAISLRRLTADERKEVVFLMAWFLLVLVGWLRWDMLTPAPGGRLLFPALPALATLMALGMELLLGRHFRWWRWLIIVALALMALITVSHILPRFFAPPRRYAKGASVQPTHALNAVWGDFARLLGYDLSLSEHPLTLDVTLYWQPITTTDEDYILALQLASPVTGDSTLRLNYNSWPGRGNYPTSAWQSGEVIADHYRLRLPEADFPTQAWDLLLILYQQQSGTRLPVRIDDIEVGNALALTRLRVPGRQPTCPPEAAFSTTARFGDAVALTHAWVVTDGVEADVFLCWEALRALPSDYTVFIHLMDVASTLTSTGDGPPMQGAFPTSLWHPGDRVCDVHRLRGKLAGKHIRVGLYDLQSGVRLPLRVGGEPVPDAAVTIWPQHP